MKTTYDLSGACVADKHAKANELEFIAVRAFCDLGLVCKFSEGGFFDDDGEYIRKTIGHTFTVAMCFVDYNSIDDEMYLDDREGDLRLQIAAVLERRASDTMEVAAALRKHYEDEVRGGGQ